LSGEEIQTADIQNLKQNFHQDFQQDANSNVNDGIMGNSVLENARKLLSPLYGSRKAGEGTEWVAAADAGGKM
jgi:hypothetical protein